MNLLDLAAIIVLVLTAWAGFRSGAFPQLGGLVGAVIAGALGVIVGIPLLVDLLGDVEPAIRALVVLLGLLGAIAIGEAIGSALGRSVSVALGTGLLGATDRVLGAVVGLVQGLFIVWLVGGLLAAGPFPTAASLAQSSAIVRFFHAVTPPPTAYADELGSLLDSTGLPDLFVGLEPSLGEPVPTPASGEARAIAGPALASTGRVTSAACRRELSGTAFVVAPGYLATNAHVVAGARTVRVNLEGDLYDATVVLFDPAVDIAVLHAPKVRAPALRLARQEPERGREGAAIGYPQGGRRVIVPVAVLDAIDAEGRDIYDERRVIRRVLALAAEIQPGDSGGPLVLDDGTVGGMVFAESKTDPAVGYALSPTEVATTIAPALGSSAEVDTGPCLT